MREKTMEKRTGMFRFDNQADSAAHNRGYSGYL